MHPLGIDHDPPEPRPHTSIRQKKHALLRYPHARMINYKDVILAERTEISIPQHLARSVDLHLCQRRRPIKSICKAAYEDGAD